MSDEQDIRRLVAERAAALRAGDAGTVVSTYAEQAVIFNLAPPLRQPGDPRAAEPVRQWLATFDGPVDLTVRDLDVTVGGDVAFCTGLSCLRATPRGGSEPFALWYRVTFGLRRVEGTWLITHEHESVPFEMDGSGRAALDLTP